MIVSEQEAIEIIQKLKQEGKKAVTTNGTFDILHLAHVMILEKSKQQGDKLFVLVNSDSSVKQNKGDNRPIIPQEERARMLDSLKCVDYVMLFDEKEVHKVLERLKPSIHCKGGSYIPERVKKEQDAVDEWINFPMIEGFSTTNVIQKVLDVYKK